MKKIIQKEPLILKKVKSISEYDNHYLIIRLLNKKAKLDGYIAIHRKHNKLPSFGATRFLDYSSKEEALRDVLKLSKLMSYKSALAGLSCGGAKAVIIKPRGEFSREKLLKAYAEELNILKGIFFTGTDVGLDIRDLNYMKKYTKFLVGYFSNPEKATSLGLVKSLDVALNYTYRNKNYSKHSFYIEGLGKVGFSFLEILIKKGVKNIYVSDIDENKISNVLIKYPFIKIIKSNEIKTLKVDVYCPCALSGVVNKKTMDYLKCKIIIGSANNQLENNLFSQNLHKRGILYCPDYIVNSGGLISVVEEYLNKGKYKEKELEKKINKIPIILKKIIAESVKMNVSPGFISDSMGLSIINKNFPK